MLQKLSRAASLAALLLSTSTAPLSLAQPPEGAPSGFGPPGFGPQGGPGFGPMGGGTIEILEKFDGNQDGWLNSAERQQALEYLNSEEGQKSRRRGFGPGGPGGFGPGGPGGFGPGGPGGFGPGGRGFGPGGRTKVEATPGMKVAPSEIKPVEGELYDPSILRTIFLDFEQPDWEKELEVFHDTDVDVPATMTVDGKEYPGVGIRFRGMSSYRMVPSGSKRSLNLALDLVDSEQRLHGYKTLNLLNAHEDESMMGTALYSHIARQYLPAPKANLVRLVVNGENWGIYNNVQQFNKEFMQENFNSTKGARWKVSGSPMGGGGMAYLGDDPAFYETHYEMKSGKKKDWEAFIELCKVLHETPIDNLESELRMRMDVDGLLWFLALDNALINCDGYWIRASDYSICRDSDGLFHILPHDMNEAFRRPMGPGMGGGRPGMAGGPQPGGRGSARNRRDQANERNNNRNNGPAGGPPPGFGPPGGMATNGVELDPLVGLDDPNKPLRSRVLNVPSLRKQYLENIRTIANESLNWDSLGNVVESYRELIDNEVKADTKKLSSYEDFVHATSTKPSESANVTKGSNGPRGGPALSLKEFADQRRAYLLKYVDERK
jgi:spore coat protein CotH